MVDNVNCVNFVEIGYLFNMFIEINFFDLILKIVWLMRNNKWYCNFINSCLKFKFIFNFCLRIGKIDCIKFLILINFIWINWLLFFGSFLMFNGYEINFYLLVFNELLIILVIRFCKYVIVILLRSGW